MQQVRIEQAGPITVEKIRADVFRQTLVQKRDFLSDQIADLTKRRNELQSQRGLLPADRANAHDQRIAVIDERVAKLETDLFAANDNIARSMAGLPIADIQSTIATPTPVLFDGYRAVAQDAVFEAFGMSTMALLSMYVLWRGFRRYIWKRAPMPGLRDQSAQLVQLQQSMDVIALEVERISEAQRYTAKLLSEKAGGASIQR